MPALSRFLVLAVYAVDQIVLWVFVAMAEFIGSTSTIIQWCSSSDADEYIVASITSLTQKHRARSRAR